MEELIKKEDGFTAWRAKLNRVFGKIAWLLSGTKEKCILTSENGSVAWRPADAVRQASVPDEFLNLGVTGVLKASGLAVIDGADFRCRIQAPAGISVLDASIEDAAVFSCGGKTEVIRLEKDGFRVGSAVISAKSVSLPPLLKLGDASIGFSKGVLNIYGKASPMKLNLNSGGAEFQYGLSAKEVSFPEGSIDGTAYTGCAARALRLDRQISIFGNGFDGTKDVLGSIENCTGISLSAEAEIVFQGIEGGSLKCSGGELGWTGTFHPKALRIETEHYCEWYKSDAVLDVGDVISLNFKSARETYVKVNSTDKHPLAVVTDDYAMSVGVRSEKTYPCCSSGRVKAKVEGKVSIGTRLTVSSTDGVLRPMTSKDKAYEQWAVALESSDVTGVKLVKIHIL